MLKYGTSLAAVVDHTRCVNDGDAWKTGSEDRCRELDSDVSKLSVVLALIDINNDDGVNGLPWERTR